MALSEPNFVRGGWVLDGSLEYIGSHGAYRPRVSRSDILAYDLHFDDSDVAPSGYGRRFASYSLRCVAIGS